MCQRPEEDARKSGVESQAVADTLRLVLAESRVVAVSGRVERTRWHRSLLGRLVRPRRTQRQRRTAENSVLRREPPSPRMWYDALAPGN